jgi:hypothetical protein
MHPAQCRIKAAGGADFATQVVVRLFDELLKGLLTIAVLIVGGILGALAVDRICRFLDTRMLRRSGMVGFPSRPHL